jgi:hypothetical protein
LVARPGTPEFADHLLKNRQTVRSFVCNLMDY